MIIVSDLQLGHWQLVIKNKSFERLLKNVEENIPEYSRMFQNVPECSRRFQSSRMF